MATYLVMGRSDIVSSLRDAAEDDRHLRVAFGRHQCTYVLSLLRPTLPSPTPTPIQSYPRVHPHLMKFQYAHPPFPKK